LKYKIFRELESAAVFMGAISLGVSFKETTVTNAVITLSFAVSALVFRYFKGVYKND